MTNSKLVYCLTSTYPSEKAHCVQISKMCEAFVGQGLAVDLFYPRYLFQAYAQNPFELFKIRRVFKLKPMPAFNFLKLPLPRRLMVLFLNLQNLGLCTWRLLFLNRQTLMMSRELPLCVLARILGFKKIIWEVHMRYPYFFKVFLKMPHCIVSISKQMQMDLQKQVPAAKILYLEDGYAPADFESTQLPQGLPQSSKIKIGYFGKATTMGIDKGLDFFLKCLAEFKTQFCPVVVGIETEYLAGIERNLQAFASEYLLKGHLPFKDALPLMQACDVLVLPYPRHPHLEQYTSPLKLFEYMACGKLILCSDLPTLTGIIKDGVNGLVYTSENAESLKKVLQKISGEYPNLKSLGLRAFEDVKPFSYDNRARQILASLR